MTYTLDNFYTSKAWRAFRERLMIERTNKDGFIICEKCGKPIMRPYDCIGHHKKELTPDNVNDADVSLNPDNVELIHLSCHNEIHERFSGCKQQVFLVYGPPCAGKSTYVDGVAHGDDLILDIDRIWDAVCKDGRDHKNKRCRAVVFQIRDTMIESIRLRRGSWRNAYIIGGYPLSSDREYITRLTGARPIYIEADMDTCLQRAEHERPEPWADYIREWFESFTE